MNLKKNDELALLIFKALNHTELAICNYVETVVSLTEAIKKREANPQCLSKGLLEESKKDFTSLLKSLSEIQKILLRTLTTRINCSGRNLFLNPKWMVDSKTDQEREKNIKLHAAFIKKIYVDPSREQLAWPEISEVLQDVTKYYCRKKRLLNTTTIKVSVPSSRPWLLKKLKFQ